MFTLATCAFALVASPNAVRAALDSSDVFGSGVNQFTIDFVEVGNAGNGTDTVTPMGPPGASNLAAGSVAYTYRIGKFEISESQIANATASGLTNVTAGAWAPDQPAGRIGWYEAAAFVNWLNESTGHQKAYDLNGTATALTLWSSTDAWQAGGENLYRHKDAYYFLPSEDEWYKAAYHKNDGVTANYFSYATGSDTAPTPVASGTLSGSAVYGGQAGPANCDQAGGLSPYGTMGQNGNLWEWGESADDGLNDSPTETRVTRGAQFEDTFDFQMKSEWGSYGDPENPIWDTPPGAVVGFRVASVPEPSVALLMIGTGLVFSVRRRRNSSV